MRIPRPQEATPTGRDFLAKQAESPAGACDSTVARPPVPRHQEPVPDTCKTPHRRPFPGGLARQSSEPMITSLPFDWGTHRARSPRRFMARCVWDDRTQDYRASAHQGDASLRAMHAQGDAEAEHRRTEASTRRETALRPIGAGRWCPTRRGLRRSRRRPKANKATAGETTERRRTSLRARRFEGPRPLRAALGGAIEEPRYRSAPPMALRFACVARPPLLPARRASSLVNSWAVPRA